MTKEKLMRYTKTQLVDMLVKETAIGISSPADALEPILKELDKIKFKEVECFICLTLNGCHKIIGTHIISKGIVNQTIVHPREVFRPAIADNAVAVIIAHNHPSGNLEPSMEDKGTTNRIKKAGELIGIKVLDHLIVSPSGNLEPSMEDKETTNRIKKAGNLLGIKVLDHLIVSPSAKGYFSFLEENIF